MRDATKTKLVVWSVQWLIGLFFVLASGAPSLLPSVSFESLSLPQPVWGVLLIGAVQLVSRRGLALPGLTSLRTSLAQLVAIGLMLLTGGATGYDKAADLDDSPSVGVAMGFSLRIPTKPGGDVVLQIGVTPVARSRRSRRHAQRY